MKKRKKSETFGHDGKTAWHAWAILAKQQYEGTEGYPSHEYSSHAVRRYGTQTLGNYQSALSPRFPGGAADRR